jgi:hypothetical protein
MAHRPLISLILLGVSLAAAGTTLAQAPPDASNPPAASPAGTPAATPVQGSDTSAAPAPPAPSTTPVAAPATSPAPASPGTPSADTIKKARVAGYRPETKNGKTLFCQETANIGTRFATKKCLDEQQIAAVFDAQRETKDNLNKPFACTGGTCVGH